MNDSVNTQANTSPKAKAKPGPKPRERSAAGLTPFESTREGLTMTDGRDSNDLVQQERIRVPLGHGQDQWMRGYKLDTVNYHYQIFHESATRGGRIAEADQALFEHCEINGDNIKRPSGSGWDYLMRLPMKYHLEDLQRDKDRRKAMERGHSQLKSDDKLQEYGVDSKGRPVFDGEAVGHTKESDNPYA